MLLNSPEITVTARTLVHSPMWVHMTYLYTSPKNNKTSTRRHAQTTHISQCDAFTAYLPSLHLSNHTHHKPYHTPLYNTLQHTLPSTIITILNHDTTHHPTTTLTSSSTTITYFTKHNTPHYKLTQTSTAPLYSAKPRIKPFCLNLIAEYEANRNY